MLAKLTIPMQSNSNHGGQKIYRQNYETETARKSCMCFYYHNITLGINLTGSLSHHYCKLLLI